MTGRTLVTSWVMRKILTRNDARELRRWSVHQADRVVADDHQLTSKNSGLSSRPSPGPVTGFADATIGGTSISLNVTSGEGTAEVAR